MASLASFSRMGARRLATVAARTVPRASMQVCNLLSRRETFVGLECVVCFREGTFGVQQCRVQGRRVEVFDNSELSDEGRSDTACS